MNKTMKNYLCALVPSLLLFLIVLSQQQGITQEEVEDTNSQITGNIVNSIYLTITDHSFNADSGHITGTVVNNSTQEIEFPTINAALYDANNQLITMESSSYTDSLPAGDNSTFDIPVSGSEYEVVQAQNQTAGTEGQQPSAEQEQQAQEFTANLTGDSEVPPVTTNATGSAEFELNDDGDEMSYDLEVGDMEGVLFAHIHQGSDSENGPIVVTLFNATDGPTDEIDGTLESGDFAAEDFEGPLQGQNMTDLVDAIEGGQAYVNVHTEANPPGEIRGTIDVAPTAASDDAGGDDASDFGEDDDDDDGVPGDLGTIPGPILPN